jgi:CheY-like chemotaxis protein
MVPEDRVERLKINPEAVSRLPPSLIRERLVVPTFLDEQQNMLSLLVADPTDLPALKAAQEFAGAERLRLFIATRSSLERLVNQLVPDEAPIKTPPPPAAMTPMMTPSPAAESGAREEATRRAVILETDPNRLRLLQELNQVEAADAAFATEPAQVTRLLEDEDFDRVFHRVELNELAGRHHEAWRKVRPGVQIIEVSGYAPTSAPPAAREGTRDFLLKLVEFALLAGETKNMDARARTRRVTHLAREVARVRELSADRAEALILCALFLYLDQLSIVSGMVGDRTTDATQTRRFELPLAVMDPLEPPYPVQDIFTALERRLVDPNAPRHEPVAELLFTLKAVVEAGAGDIADAGTLLGDKAERHDPEVLTVISTVLRREQLIGRLAREGSGESGGATIVIAEREAALVTALESRLAQAGYEVIAVADGEAALQRARTLKPSAVIANQRLPRRDGLSLLLELKRDEETNTIPVIILTDRADAGAVTRGLDFGAEDVLEKPVNLQVLMARLRKVAGRPKRARSSGIVGRLADLSLLDLLQTLHLGSKDAEVVITAPAGRGGINLYEGQIVAARYDRLQGEDALFALVGLRDGLFEVRFGAQPPVPNIGMPTEPLMLEAARRLDEANAGS